jgi:hypothetical protein
MNTNETNQRRCVTLAIRTDQLAWIDAEAKRIEIETGGVHVSRSAIVRRVLDEACEKASR